MKEAFDDQHDQGADLVELYKRSNERLNKGKGVNMKKKSFVVFIFFISLIIILSIVNCSTINTQSSSYPYTTNIDHNGRMTVNGFTIP